MAEKSVSIPCHHLTVAYLEQGDPAGIPVLCLHGNMGSKHWWTPLFDILPTDFYLVAPDLRGCGATTYREAIFDIEVLVSDLHNFEDALGLHSFSLVAHSTSCPVALEYALHFPHKLQCLVLVSGPPLQGIKTPPEMYRYLQSLLRDPAQMEAMLRSLMPNLDLKRTSNRALLAQMVDDALRMAPKAADGFTRNLESWSGQKRATGLSMPLLLVRGREDHIVPHDVALQTLLSIPGANNLEIIQGAGHVPMVENPEALAIRLIDFIVQDFGAYSALGNPGS